MTKRQKPVCQKCGSDDVRTDAWAKWSEEDQDWVLGETFDQEHCENCEGETSLKWIDGAMTQAEQIEDLKAALKSIGDQYDNQDMSHVDFRVGAARIVAEAQERHK